MYVMEIYEKCPIAHCGDTYRIIMSGDKESTDRSLFGIVTNAIFSDKEMDMSVDYQLDLANLISDQNLKQNFECSDDRFSITYKVIEKNYVLQYQEGN